MAYSTCSCSPPFFLSLSLFHSCKAQRNLNSFFAIIMGLNSPAVSRLTQTLEVGRQQLQCIEIHYYICGVVVRFSTSILVVIFRSKKLECIANRAKQEFNSSIFLTVLISESPWEVQEVVLRAGEPDGKWLSHHNLKLPPASSPPARAFCAVYGSLGCNIWSRNHIRDSREETAGGIREEEIWDKPDAFTGKIIQICTH